MLLTPEVSRAPEPEAPTSKTERFSAETPAATNEPARVPFRHREGRPKLDDLWFLVGSRCNLRCIHCYVGSSPENGTLEPLAPDEVERFLVEAADHGLARSYFTGGEPFVNPHVLDLMRLALEFAPLTILTNATRPLARRLDDVASIADRWEPGRLSFRVSLDHYDEARHDGIRGEGSFVRTVETVRGLVARGFRPIVTLTGEVFRGNPAPEDRIARRVRDLFRATNGDTVDVKILPHVLPMGAQASRLDATPTDGRVTDTHLRAVGVEPASLMCANGRSVLKTQGRTRVYPCPVIYDVPEFDLGGTLAESFEREVPLAHVGCGTYCCKAVAGRCTN